MITESQKRIIRRKCDIVIAMCYAALEHVTTLEANCLTEDHKSIERMASDIRRGMFEASILRDTNDIRKVSECQHDK
jgi:hypothetical protein